MLNERQSFLISLAGHLAVLVVLLVVGALVARRIMGPKPIEVELIGPFSPAPPSGEESSSPIEPDTPEEVEPEPEIIERPKEPGFDPNRSIDPNKIPDVAEETYKPYKPTVTVPDHASGGASSPETSYLALIVAVCERNWEKTKPPRGLLGQTVPTLDVVITIRRDGRILAHRITRSSGNAALDRSVRKAIQLSDPLPAFPSDMRGAQQDFELRFVLDD